MRIRPFDFKTAKSLDDAFSLLESAGPGGKIIAGGTDLVLGLKKQTTTAKTIISLHTLTDLETVKELDGTICIGALAKHADLAKNPILEKKVHILCQAVGLIGSWQIRNAGTIGGNLCNASPAADGAPPLLVLDASLLLAGKTGIRTVPISSFFTGPGKTVLAENEILKEIHIPSPSSLSAGCYLKLRRRKAVDISIAGVAFQAQMDPEGRIIEKCGIALSGVAPTPIRVPDAEQMLLGLTPKEVKTKIEACAETCANAANPIDDIRASADYKRTIVNVFLQRSAHHVLDTLEGKRGK